MTQYEKMIKKSNQCLEKAQSTSDLDLRLFYLNTSKGLKIKANNLSIEEAGEIVE